MKYIHLFENYLKHKPLNRKQISFLEESVRGIHSGRGSWYTDYSDDSAVVNVHGSVRLSKTRKSLVGIKFGRVEGDFSIAGVNSFTGTSGLKGFPKFVGKTLSINTQRVGTLEDLPTEEVKEFSAFGCLLKSLVGCPRIVRSRLDVSYNVLSTLEGAPEIMNDNASVIVSNNPLVSLEGLPPNLNTKFIFTESKSMYIPNMSNVISSEFLISGYEEFKKTGSWIPYYIKLDSEYSGQGFFTDEFILEKLEIGKIQEFINKRPAESVVIIGKWWRKEIAKKLIFPSEYKKELDLITDLDGIGL